LDIIRPSSPTVGHKATQPCGAARPTNVSHTSSLKQP
jgi:hypothetical protein